MVFDYSNLKGEIKKKFNSYSELATATGLGKTLIQERLRLGKPFKIDEVMKIMNALSLSITSETIIDLFFIAK